MSEQRHLEVCLGKPGLLLLRATSRAFRLLHHQACRNCTAKSQPIPTAGPKGHWQSEVQPSSRPFVDCSLVFQLQSPEYHAHSYCQPLHVPFPLPGIPSTGLSTRQTPIHLSVLSTNILFPEVSFDFSSPFETLVLCSQYAFYLRKTSILVSAFTLVISCVKAEIVSLYLYIFRNHKLAGYECVLFALLVS